MKFSAGDISYIDCVHFVYPSFFTWTLNERIREYTQSGPPKEWMLRQNERHHSDAGSEMAEGEGDDGMEVVKQTNGDGIEAGGENGEIPATDE